MKNCRFATISLCLMILFAFNSTALSQNQKNKIDAEALFSTKCAVCHTIGQGKRIGPDLKGVTKRKGRTTAWLKKMIKNPTEMLQTDPIAKVLLKEHNNVPMINMGLNDAEVEALIKYLTVKQSSE